VRNVFKCSSKGLIEKGKNPDACIYVGVYVSLNEIKYQFNRRSYNHTMKKLIFAAFLLSALYFMGCKKSEFKSDLSKPITNAVLLFDENNNAVNDNSGTTISIEEVGAGLPVNIVTDSKGEFTLPLIKTSSITLVYSHPGYGIIKQYYTQSALDSIAKGIIAIEGVNLYPISSVVVNSASAKIENNELTITCNVSVPKQASLNAIRFIIQKDNSDVSYSNCISNRNITKSFPVVNGDNIITVCTPCEVQCGYQSGDALYMKAYGDISFLNSYTDPFANKIVLPCINPNSNSSVISFIVP